MIAFLTDPAFYGFLIFSVIFFLFQRERVESIFISGFRENSELIDNDYFIFFLVSTLIFYPIFSVAAAITNTYVSLNIFGFDIFFTTATVVVAVVYTIILSKMWSSMFMENDFKGLMSLFVIVTFSAVISTYLVVGLDPNTDAVASTIADYINVASTILGMISTLAILPMIQRMLQYVYQIFMNNIGVAVRSALFAAAGGVSGFTSMIAFTHLFSSAIVAGTIGGIILRNNLDKVYAGTMSLLAVTGLPPFWHMFFEYMGFAVIAASVGILVFSVISKKQVIFPIKGIISGVLLILAGALIEVTFGTSFAYMIISVLKFSPVISDIQLNLTYAVNLVLAIITSLIIGVFIVYMVRFIINLFEKIEMGGE